MFRWRKKIISAPQALAPQYILQFQLCSTLFPSPPLPPPHPFFKKAFKQSGYLPDFLIVYVGIPPQSDAGFIRIWRCFDLEKVKKKKNLSSPKIKLQYNYIYKKKPSEVRNLLQWLIGRLLQTVETLHMCNSVQTLLYTQLRQYSMWGSKKTAREKYSSEVYIEVLVLREQK